MVQFLLNDSYPFQTQGRGVSLVEKWETADANASGAYTFFTNHDEDAFNFVVQTENGNVGVFVPLSENMALDTWYSISGVYDGEFMRLYINGELIGETQGTAIAPVNATDYPLEIANIGNNVTTFFDGSIDHLEIWDIAFSDLEIQSSMEDSLTGDEPNLIGLWNFNEGEGDILFDKPAIKIWVYHWCKLGIKCTRISRKSLFWIYVLWLIWEFRLLFIK